MPRKYENSPFSEVRAEAQQLLVGARGDVARFQSCTLAPQEGLQLHRDEILDGTRTMVDEAAISQETFSLDTSVLQDPNAPGSRPAGRIGGGETREFPTPTKEVPWGPIEFVASCSWLRSL